MKEKFDAVLKNGLSEYDKTYLPTFQYVMMLCNKGRITPYFANVDYTAFIEYPVSEKEYSGPEEVLESEMSLGGCEAGIIYENIDGVFTPIALIDKTEERL